MLLDPEIRDWVLFPIMAVMFLIGMLRHYLTLIFNQPTNSKSSSVKAARKAIREQQALQRTIRLRHNANHIPSAAFEARRDYLSAEIEAGKFLKQQSSVNQPGLSDLFTNAANNPDQPPQLPPQLQDPEQYEVMMDGMKKNMLMLVPQMLIMGWITAFFSGFVVIKLPMPLTVRFKSMLQTGIVAADMDVSWVSSLSWYFVNLFGLKGVFSLLLGQDNQSATAMMTPASQMQQTPQAPDMAKVFQSERDSLSLVKHSCILNGIEDRTIRQLTLLHASVDGESKKSR